jgi:hypothetical protein
MNIINKTKSWFPLFFAISSGLTFSMVIPGFWFMTIGYRWGLLVLFSGIFLFIYHRFFNYIWKIVDFSKTNRLKYLLILLLSLFITYLFGQLFINKWINLPTVPLEIELSIENPHQIENPEFFIESLSINNKFVSIERNMFSKECQINNDGHYSNSGGTCIFSYPIDVSKDGQVNILFATDKMGGVVDINIRALHETIDLYQVNNGNHTFTVSYSPDFSPKKIRYPLVLIIYISIFINSLCILLGSDGVITTYLNKQNHTGKKISALTKELLVLIIFFVIAFMFTCGRLGNHPFQFLQLESDAANIASFSAAYDNPENYTRDPFLSDPQNYSAYFAFHIPLIRTLGKLFGSYTTAFTILLFPVIIVQLFGFYLLGKKLYSNRLIAFLLSLATMLPIRMPVYEYFGLNNDVIPRFLFQAILPYLLMLLLNIIDTPSKWWLGGLAFSAGLYIHPVSGPAWIMAYYLSILFVTNIKEIRFWWLYFIKACFFTVLGMLPFIWAFFVPSGNEIYNIPLIKEIMSERLASQTESVFSMYSNYFQTYVATNWPLIVLWLVTIGFLIELPIQEIIKRNKIDDGYKHNHKAVYAWWIAILFASIVIPLLDEIYIQKTGGLPVLREIRRNLRYFIPLLWITIFIFISQINRWMDQKGINKPAKGYLACIICVFMAIYAVQSKSFINNAFRHEFICLQQGKLFCQSQAGENEKIEFYQAVTRLVGKEELIFPDPSPDYMQDSLIPRYFCLRSIAYTYKDGGGAGSTTMQFITDWWRITQKLDPYLPNSEHPLKIDVLDIAKETGAEYFIFISPDPEIKLQLNQNCIAFQNEYGILYDLTQ